MTSSLSTSEFLKVTEHKLSNDLTVWLNEDHSQPMVFGAVVVKAGAKDSPNTGIAHYFEHMMFKGTDKIGTTDYDSEKALLDIIAEKYDALADTKDPEMRQHLQKIINDLSVRAAKYVIPNEFDRLITRYGGTKLNAGTSYDFTLYFNTFSPQYFAQWAEINSERLINPVFRMFQSELETVYEEKNMYEDAVASMATEKVIERYFYPHPYAYPIIGSAENLKNPRLTEMRKFFEKYYVASNMGLIVSGDFNTEEVLPILESTFSRVRKGTVERKEATPLPPFKGKEKITVRIPMPFVKIMAMAFRGVPANHPDQVALNVAVSLLNNSNGTGFLDKLTVDHKVMGAMAVNQSLNEAGVLGLLVFPKFLFQTHSSAEKLVWSQINRVKEGDFTDEMFSSLKLEQKREYTSKLEDINSRADVMMRVFSQGKSWKEYLDEVSLIDALTREDVIRVAKKYFTNNYLYITKTTGRYLKVVLPKPDYAPIIPQNREASSDYSKQLEQIAVKKLAPHFLDFEHDAEVVNLNPLVKLYKTDNPVNDIFSLTISYGIGGLELHNLRKLAAYLSFLGTESLSFNVFRSKLQTLGSTLLFDASDSDFAVIVNGFDDHFEETMALVGDFMRHVNADDKKMRQIVDEAKVTEKSLLQSNDGMAKVLLEKVKFDKESRYLTKMSLSEVKKLKGKTMLELFHQVLTYSCDLHYCGTLDTAYVIDQVKKNLPLEQVVEPSHSLYIRGLQKYDEPTVYFMHMPHVKQSIVYAYMHVDPLLTSEERYVSRLFSNYFGGDMSSVLFQELREFRSFAYNVGAQLLYPPYNQREKPSSLVIRLATQSDKMIDAMTVLEQLIQEMPTRPEHVESVKQTIRNWINNEYPTSRAISTKISGLQKQGYTCDPNQTYLETIEKMSMDDIWRFYQKHVQGRPMTYAIVGNEKVLDLKQLSRFGKVIKINKKDIYR